MSEFEFACGACGGAIKAWEEHIGAVSECPHCQVPLVVPTPARTPLRIAVSSPKPTRSKRSKHHRWFLVLAGMAAVSVVGAVVVSALGLIPNRIGIPHLSSIVSGDDRVGDSEPSSFEEFDPNKLPVRPLSEYRENRWWSDLLASPERVVHLVNYDVELRKLTKGGGDWISPQKPDLERYGFQMGLAFVQRVGRVSRSESNMFREERFQDWFERIDFGSADEFQKRDLESKERKAVEEILERVPKGTPYTVVTDWLCRLAEYDFERGAFPLVVPWNPEFEFGSLGIRPIDFRLIHVSEKNARELRDEGISHICLRRTFRLKWEEGWFHTMVDPDLVSTEISEIDSSRTPSPLEWAVSLMGNDILTLHRVNESFSPTKETSDAFSKTFGDFHRAYMDQSVSHYKPFSVLITLKRTDADSYLSVISRLQAEREIGQLLKLSDEWDEVETQFRLLQAPQEANDLFETYSEGVSWGLVFMKATTPTDALDFLDGWLNSHGSMNELHDKILAEITKFQGH